MSFIFTMRSTRVDGANANAASLPPIDEDEMSITTAPSSPAVPPRAWNRPAHKGFGLGAPPKPSFEKSPPAYSQFDSTGVEGPNGEKLADVRKNIVNNKHIAARGGWRRLAIAAIVSIIAIVALVVGLVVGLRNRHNNSSSTSGNSSSIGGASGTEPGQGNPASNTTFPAGSYSVETFLDTVYTNCTSNPATWRCYPYSTYAQSPSASVATFDWIISPIEGSSNYSISSTASPFSILFQNKTMVLLDAGTDQERYFFQFQRQQVVIPGASLTSSGVTGTCYFNQTTFQASLYTKMARTFPSTSTEGANSTQAFGPWPYAIRVEMVQGAGAGTPTCLDSAGQSLGDFSVSDPTQLCDCLYLNTGT